MTKCVTIDLSTVLMRFFGYPYNDLVICKDSPDYLDTRLDIQHIDNHSLRFSELCLVVDKHCCSYMLMMN